VPVPCFEYNAGLRVQDRAGAYQFFFQFLFFDLAAVNAGVTREDFQFGRARQHTRSKLDGSGIKSVVLVPPPSPSDSAARDAELFDWKCCKAVRRGLTRP